jgi:hypothetical protein
MLGRHSITELTSVASISLTSKNCLYLMVYNDVLTYVYIMEWLNQTI